MLVNRDVPRPSGVARVAVSCLLGGTWFVFLTSLVLAVVAIGVITLVTWLVLLPRALWRMRSRDHRYLRDLRWAGVVGVANAVGYALIAVNQFRDSGAASWHEYFIEYGQWSGDLEGVIFVGSAILLLVGVVLTATVRRPRETLLDKATPT